MAEINWKAKYTELKAKYMNDVDTAFRLGIEQGAQMAQQQQAAEQAAQEQAMAQAQAQGQPGAEGGEQAPGAEQVEGQPMQESEHPAGSELDQHIATLEGMLGKSEITAEDLASMKKSIESLKFGIEMKKSDAAIKGIVKAIKPAKSPVTMSKAASANLGEKQKSALNMQEKIVSNIMKSWEEQEKSLSKSIVDIVAQAGHKKD